MPATRPVTAHEDLLSVSNQENSSNAGQDAGEDAAMFCREESTRTASDIWQECPRITHENGGAQSSLAPAQPQLEAQGNFAEVSLN